MRLLNSSQCFSVKEDGIPFTEVWYNSDITINREMSSGMKWACIALGMHTSSVKREG